MLGGLKPTAKPIPQIGKKTNWLQISLLKGGEGGGHTGDVATSTLDSADFFWDSVGYDSNDGEMGWGFESWDGLAIFSDQAFYKLCPILIHTHMIPYVQCCCYCQQREHQSQSSIVAAIFAIAQFPLLLSTVCWFWLLPWGQIAQRKYISNFGGIQHACMVKLLMV